MAKTIGMEAYRAAFVLVLLSVGVLQCDGTCAGVLSASKRDNLPQRENRFLLNDPFNYDQLPPSIKNILPVSAEVDSRCKFDLSSTMSRSSLETLRTFYNRNLSICVGCDFTNEMVRTCHMASVCRSGAVCVAGINADYDPGSLFSVLHPTYRWHGCCMPGTLHCQPSRTKVSIGYNVNPLLPSVHSSITYQLQVCDSVLCNADNHTDAANVQRLKYVLQQDSVDGGWGKWSAWSVCTSPCGDGQRHRSRQCDNPLPRYGGAPCVGDRSVSKWCARTTQCHT